MVASPRRAQSRVQHGAVFGDIDFLAAEHRVHALAQAGFVRQLNQQLQGLIGDAVFGIIQEETGGFGGELLAAPEILRE